MLGGDYNGYSCLKVDRAAAARGRGGHGVEVGRGREAEVRHPRHVVGAEQHVLGLEVEVDDLVRVHGLHAARDAREQRDDRVDRGEAALAHLVRVRVKAIGLG